MKIVTSHTHCVCVYVHNLDIKNFTAFCDCNFLGVDGYQCHSIDKLSVWVFLGA